MQFAAQQTTQSPKRRSVLQFNFQSCVLTKKRRPLESQLQDHSLSGLSSACSPCCSKSPEQPKELPWTAGPVPRNDSLSGTQQLGLEGLSGVTSSKPHSKQGLFRRGLAAQGRGGWSRMQIPQPLYQRDLPVSLAELSRALLGSDILSFVFFNTPLLALHLRASMEPHCGDRPAE